MVAGRQVFLARRFVPLACGVQNYLFFNMAQGMSTKQIIDRIKEMRASIEDLQAQEGRLLATLMSRAIEWPGAHTSNGTPDMRDKKNKQIIDLAEQVPEDFGTLKLTKGGFPDLRTPEGKKWKATKDAEVAAALAASVSASKLVSHSVRAPPCAQLPLTCATHTPHPARAAHTQAEGGGTAAAAPEAAHQAIALDLAGGSAAAPAPEAASTNEDN